MSLMKKLIETVYFPGRPVRVSVGASRPPGVPNTLHDGIVLKAIEVPGQSIRLFVETDRSCQTPPKIYDQEDVELLEVDEGILRKNLYGRKVYFLPNSDIWTQLPKNALDHGRICGVSYINCRLTISIVVEVKGAPAPFVTPIDLTQCDLVACQEPDEAD